MIEVRHYPEETQAIAGRSYRLAEMKPDEAEAFNNWLAYRLGHLHPILQQHVINNAEAIFKLIRAVKVKTKQDFKGEVARSNELTLKFIDEDDINSGAPFVKTVTNGWQNFIGSESAQRTMDEDKAEIYLAFVNPVDTPLARKLRFVKDGDAYVIRDLEYDTRFDRKYVPTALLQHVWSIPPESKFYVRVKYLASGTDALTPIGFRVVKATELMTEA